MNGYPGPGKLPSSRANLVRCHPWMYFCGVLCALFAVLTAFGFIKRPGRRIAGQPNNSVTEIGRGAATAVELPQERMYPYSVVPGGVHSPQELRNAIAHDPQVAGLYANFDLSRAHIERLTRDREVYVAYRYKNRIYWTKRRLLLRAGETVITDGKETGRTRCGNRVSDTPMQPVTQDEPPNAAANAPVGEFGANPSLLPALPMQSAYPDPRGNGLALLPQSPPAPATVPTGFFSIAGGGPRSFPSVTPPPPVSTPEPGALPLLALGFIAVGLLAVSRTRKARKT